jgi:hypothetical protein
VTRYEQVSRRPAARPAPERFILTVDHQPKRGFDVREAAEDEARRIRARYPHLDVRIEDYLSDPALKSERR